MTDITFMIGNGFDMQLGLDTGFNQFLNWYVLQPSDSENIALYKEDLINEPDSLWWSDAEKAMGEHVGKFDSSNISLYYERVRDFKIQLAKYLRQQQERCDYSDANYLGDNFSSFLRDFHTEILLNKVRNQFSMNNSITYNFITFNYTNVLNKLLEKTKATRHNIYQTKIGPNSYVYGTIGQLEAVHGSLSSSIIMGVNDESQLRIPPENISPKLRRTLIKPETNNALGRQDDSVAELIIQRSDVIAIYGLKLGDTDKKWRDMIGSWLKEDYHYIVIFGHEDLKGVNTLIPEDTLDYVAGKQEKFLKTLYPVGTEDFYDRLRDKVFVINKTSFLSFNLIKKELATVK